MRRDHEQLGLIQFNLLLLGIFIAISVVAITSRLDKLAELEKSTQQIVCELYTERMTE